MVKREEMLIQQVIDRHEIADCVVRYCRGIDRHDAQLVGSAFHTDAVEDHGAFRGLSSGLMEWVDTVVQDKWPALMHIIHNQCIELDGDSAHVETYFTAYNFRHEGGAEVFFG